jgi:hypothetical protein
VCMSTMINFSASHRILVQRALIENVSDRWLGAAIHHPASTQQLLSICSTMPPEDEPLCHPVVWICVHTIHLASFTRSACLLVSPSVPPSSPPSAKAPLLQECWQVESTRFTP